MTRKPTLVIHGSTDAPWTCTAEWKYPMPVAIRCPCGGSTLRGTIASPDDDLDPGPCPVCGCRLVARGEKTATITKA